MNFEEILERLQTITTNIGRFPSHRDLLDLSEFKLRNSIVNSDLSLVDYALELGIYVPFTPKGHWNEETLTEAYQQICEKYDGWPTKEIWQEHNFLIVATYRNGFKPVYFREKLGIKHLSGQKNKTCLQCKKDFIPLIGKNTSRQKFCSPECSENHFRIKQNERNAKRIKQPKVCPICSKIFIPKTTTKQKYCERNCYIKLRKRIDKAVRTCFEMMDTHKSDCCHKLLGYSPEDLLNHLETFDTWNTLKTTDWHLDHIFPIKAFLDHDIRDVGIICCLENLRPLSSNDNLIKGDKYDKLQFEQWINNY